MAIVDFDPFLAGKIGIRLKLSNDVALAKYTRYDTKFCPEKLIT